MILFVYSKLDNFLYLKFYMLHPDFEWNSVKMIFLEPYFMLYGEVYADTIDRNSFMKVEKNKNKLFIYLFFLASCDPDKPDEPACQYGHWITPLTMTIFMIVACLLFLTILIASFK